MGEVTQKLIVTKKDLECHDEIKTHTSNLISVVEELLAKIQSQETEIQKMKHKETQLGKLYTIKKTQCTQALAENEKVKTEMKKLHKENKELSNSKADLAKLLRNLK